MLIPEISFDEGKICGAEDRLDSAKTINVRILPL